MNMRYIAQYATKKKVTKPETSKCECGRRLGYTISPFETRERRVCRCGREHYVDDAPLNLNRVTRGRGREGKL